MKSLFFLAGLFFATSVFATDPDAIIGVWKNGSGKGHIEIFRQNGKYYGKVIWLRDAVDADGKPKLDRKNSDPAKRSQPLIGLVMLKNFEYDDGEWDNGRIYNPSDGKEYKAYMKLKDNETLEVRGYVGFSLFGKTDVWKRVKK